MKKNTSKPIQKTPRITPLGDRVLVQEIKEKAGQTDSGIYIPENAKDDRGAKKGKVIAVGKGRHDDGILVPMSVSVGDTVLFQWGETLVLEGEEYYIVREGEISAILK